MKYFTEKIEEQFLTQGDDQWPKNHKAYWEEFNHIAEKFPRLFVKEYEKTAFHDFEILSINWYPDKKRKNSVLIQIQMQYDDFIYTIRYFNITHLTLNFEKSLWGQYNNYLYGEILPANANAFSHEITFGERNLIYFEFTNLKFNKRRAKIVKRRSKDSYI